MSIKSLLLSVFIITVFTANATTYYFSASGNDANNGISASTPWKTLNKFNLVFASKSAGDIFVFKRGDVFYGSLVISRSGVKGLPVTIGAYGTGAKPVISGFTEVKAWTNLGSNIWESTDEVSTLSYTSMVTVNGVNTPMGRYPNTGYLIWQTHEGNVIGSPSTLTSSSLAGGPDWTGAEVAFNSTTYIISRDKITAQSGGTLTYVTPNPKDLFSPASHYFIQSFIIQNDARTLDTTNEWYYNPSTKKIRIYNTVRPANVQVSTIDTLVYLNGRNYITFDNISFRGANSSAIEANASTHIVVQNCDFNFSGKNAIHGLYNSGLTSWKVESCTFNHTYNNAVDLGASAFDTVRLNTIQNTGTVPFNMAFYSNAADAIMCQGANNLIEYNRIDSVGYCGIRHLRSNTIIRNNYISNYCVQLYDGGGTYTWNGPLATYSGIKILNNIILNGRGLNHGIYLDQASNGILIQGNTLVNAERGIYLNNAFNVQILNNTSYNNKYGILIDKRDSTIGSNIVVKNNIFFAKTPAQKEVWLLTGKEASMPVLFTADSNSYVRPAEDNLPANMKYARGYVLKKAGEFKSKTEQDANSGTSPQKITDVTDLRFEFNPTAVNKTIKLDGNYTDVKNAQYNGSVTLAPFTSVVLIRGSSGR